MIDGTTFVGYTEIPLQREVWRHWKGDEYTIIGITQRISTKTGTIQPKFMGICTETNEELGIILMRRNNSKFLLAVKNGMSIPQNKVVYSSGTKIFLRNLDNFMQVIQRRDLLPVVCWHRRFERVTQTSISLIDINQEDIPTV